MAYNWLLREKVSKINDAHGFSIELVENSPGRFTLANTPFPVVMDLMTSTQMSWYLTGLEDALDGSLKLK